MAKASMKLKGREVGPATVYAKNDTGEAKMRQAITKPGNGVDKLNMSTGNYGKDNYEPMNKHGEIKIRGTGAATKGTKARGPMA